MKKLSRFEIHTSSGLLVGFLFSPDKKQSHHYSRDYVVWVRPNRTISLGEGWLNPGTRGRPKYMAVEKTKQLKILLIAALREAKEGD